MKTRKVFDKGTGRIIDEVEISILFNHPDSQRFFLTMQSDEELSNLMETQQATQNYEGCKCIKDELERRKSCSIQD